MHSRRAFLVVLLLLVGVAPAQYGDDSVDRDRWQRPEEVLSIIGLRPGMTIADIGAGQGYFTFRMARRVGPKGKVYAEDIATTAVQTLRARAKKEKLPQIEVIQGTYIDPKLPREAVDIAFIADSYHEFRAYQAMLARIHEALKPGGTMVVIDKGTSRRLEREEYLERHAIFKDDVIQDAEGAGFRLLKEEKGFTNDRGQEIFFLIFAKPEA